MKKYECGNCQIEMDYEEQFCIKCENEGYHYCEKCEKPVKCSYEYVQEGKLVGLFCLDCYCSK